MLAVMHAFFETELGKAIAKNGILSIVLAWALYSNHNMVERLFVVIENNTRAFEEVKAALRGEDYGRR